MGRFVNVVHSINSKFSTGYIAVHSMMGKRGGDYIFGLNIRGKLDWLGCLGLTHNPWRCVRG